jgi:hypothetical protein
LIDVKWLAVLASLLATPAVAQQANDPVALGNELLECVGGKVQLRSRIAQLEAEVARLKPPPPQPPAPPAEDAKPK